MDSRRERELEKQLPFKLDPLVSPADRLPIRAERLIGFTLLIATYVLLTCLPFAVVFWVLYAVDDIDRQAIWFIMSRTFAVIWFGSLLWLFVWFVVYVVLDLKHPSTLGRIPGAPSDLDDLVDETE